MVILLDIFIFFWYNIINLLVHCTLIFLNLRRWEVVLMAVPINYSMALFRLQLAIGDLKYQQRRKALSDEQKNEIEKYCEKIKKIMTEMQQK